MVDICGKFDKEKAASIQIKNMNKNRICVLQSYNYNSKD